MEAEGKYVRYVMNGDREMSTTGPFTAGGTTFKYNIYGDSEILEGAGPTTMDLHIMVRIVFLFLTLFATHSSSWRFRRQAAQSWAATVNTVRSAKAGFTWRWALAAGIRFHKKKLAIWLTITVYYQLLLVVTRVSFNETVK